LWSLNGGDEDESFSPMALFGSLFKQGSGAVVAAPWADMHLIVGASCQELPAIQRLHELAPDKPIVCFNLKLDVLRGDLGLPAFPPKAVHHEFLCRVKPTYYLRPRSYSLSLSVPPFLIAYQGVLFRRCARAPRSSASPLPLPSLDQCQCQYRCHFTTGAAARPANCAAAVAPHTRARRPRGVADAARSRQVVLPARHGCRRPSQSGHLQVAADLCPQAGR
jgi:hypothetical protein